MLRCPGYRSKQQYLHFFFWLKILNQISSASIYNASQSAPLYYLQYLYTSQLMPSTAARYWLLPISLIIWKSLSLYNLTTADFLHLLSSHSSTLRCILAVYVTSSQLTYDFLSTAALAQGCLQARWAACCMRSEVSAPQSRHSTMALPLFCSWMVAQWVMSMCCLRSGCLNWLLQIWQGTMYSVMSMSSGLYSITVVFSHNLLQPTLLPILQITSSRQIIVWHAANKKYSFDMLDWQDTKPMRCSCSHYIQFALPYQSISYAIVQLLHISIN